MGGERKTARHSDYRHRECVRPVAGDSLVPDRCPAAEDSFRALPRRNRGQHDVGEFHGFRADEPGHRKHAHCFRNAGRHRLYRGCRAVPFGSQSGQPATVTDGHRLQRVDGPVPVCRGGSGVSRVVRGVAQYTGNTTPVLRVGSGQPPAAALRRPGPGTDRDRGAHPHSARDARFRWPPPHGDQHGAGERSAFPRGAAGGRVGGGRPGTAADSGGVGGHAQMGAGAASAPARETCRFGSDTRTRRVAVGGGDTRHVCDARHVAPARRRGGGRLLPGGPGGG